MMIDVVMALVVVVLIEMTMPEVGCLQMKDRLVVIFNFSLVSYVSLREEDFLMQSFQGFFKLQTSAHDTTHTRAIICRGCCVKLRLTKVLD